MLVAREAFGSGAAMGHNYEAQRRETFATFKGAKGLPEMSAVDFLFFVEELDADWAAFEKALRARGFATRRLGDRETEHLLFTQENVNWEIWIDAEGPPLPRKVVITRKNEPGSPQFVAVLGRWDLAAVPAADTFEFRPPPGAKQVTMRRLFEGGEGDRP